MQRATAIHNNIVPANVSHYLIYALLLDTFYIEKKKI